MAEIRKLTPGRGITSVVALHGFVTNAEGDLIYTKSTDTTDLVDETKAVNRLFNILVNRNTANTGNVYFLNGVENPVIYLERRQTYIFDQSDVSNVTYGGGSPHPLLFSNVANGKLSGGTTYDTGVEYILDGVVVNEASYVSGFSSATERRVVINLDANAPGSLYYWCNYHNGMGNSITIGDNNLDSIYKAYEIGTSGYAYKINASGELVFEYESDE